jgi:HK97 family phage major capsid protein
MAQQFAAAENSFFTVGTGSSQPQGIVAGLSGVAGSTFGFASGGTYDFDLILDLTHTVAPQYRTGPKCAYMMHDTIMKVFRKVKAVSGGTYIWEPSQQVGQPDTIYGKPVYYNQSMTSSGSSATNLCPVIFGNFDYFWIGDRQGLDVKTANELYLAKRPGRLLRLQARG